MSAYCYTAVAQADAALARRSHCTSLQDSAPDPSQHFIGQDRCLLLKCDIFRKGTQHTVAHLLSYRCLSCSPPVQTVLDALRARKERFVFEEVEVSLKSTVMAFITMNPGYPGRAELPESLKASSLHLQHHLCISVAALHSSPLWQSKLLHQVCSCVLLQQPVASAKLCRADVHIFLMQALFRPVSMCVPDLALIVEIMLMAEGFNMSKLLSRKFVILYKLCEDLLSKSKHYDWKLRAIKTTLYVAGGMKRAAPELSEDKVSTC